MELRGLLRGTEGGWSMQRHGCRLLLTEDCNWQLGQSGATYPGVTIRAAIDPAGSGKASACTKRIPGVAIHLNMADRLSRRGQPYTGLQHLGWQLHPRIWTDLDIPVSMQAPPYPVSPCCGGFA